MFRTTFAVLSLCGWCSAQTPADPKLEFEVVTLKASPPDPRGYVVGCTGGPGTKDPELFRCQNMSVGNMMSRAYDIPHYRLSGPDWMDSPIFQLNARVPAGTTKEQFQMMLQNMLADRLKLTIHHETREYPMYEMVLAKGGPKFKPAIENPPPSADADVPARRPAPANGPNLDKEGYPIVTGEGMAMTNGKARMHQPKCTMETLAARIAGQLGKPVKDATGLTGKYEITIYWATGDGPRKSSSGASSSEPETASEPDSAPTFLRALQDQLGLRLEPKKGPVDFIVIDHVEKTPVEN